MNSPELYLAALFNPCFPTLNWQGRLPFHLVDQSEGTLARQTDRQSDRVTKANTRTVRRNEHVNYRNRIIHYGIGRTCTPCFWLICHSVNSHSYITLGSSSIFVLKCSIVQYLKLNGFFKCEILILKSNLFVVYKFSIADIAIAWNKQWNKIGFCLT